MKLLPVVVVILAGCCLLASCGGGQAEDPPQPEPEQPAPVLQPEPQPELLVAPEPSPPTPPAAAAPEPLSQEELEPFMPQAPQGFQPVEQRGGRKRVGGLDVVYSETIFQHPGGGMLMVAINDSGAERGMAMYQGHRITQTGLHIDNETELVRTSTLAGWPAVEMLKKEMLGATVAVLVADRLLVEVRGMPMRLEDLRAYVEHLDFAGMAARVGE